MAISAQVEEMHTFAMEYRKSRGLPYQELDNVKCKIAQNWANHMAEVGRMFHGGGEEIIAYTSIRNALPSGGIKQWIGSPGHDQWLRTRAYSTCGFGYATSKYGTYYAGDYTGADGGMPGGGSGGPVIPKPPKFNWLDLILRWFGTPSTFPRLLRVEEFKDEDVRNFLRDHS